MEEWDVPAQSNFAHNKQAEEIPDALIYPNPNDGTFFGLQFSGMPDKPFLLNVYDYTGRCVEQKQIANNENGYYEITLDTALPNGIYLIEVMCEVNNKSYKISKSMVVSK